MTNAFASPRYLLPVDRRRMAHWFTDVLVIGGGLAGLRAANAVPTDQNVLVVTKNELPESNSTYAQGGIAGVLDPADRIEDHVSDTLIAGGTLCDPDVVDRVIREGPERIRELIAWGTKFDEKLGQLNLTREGGHSHSRIAHALGDATGREIMRAVIAWTRRANHISIWENSFTVDLITHGDVCCGAVIVRPGWGATMVWAKQTILATGGAGQIFRETTNPEVATGDGHAAAFRAGAELRDLEFMQFHPTVLYIAGSSRSLLTEALRGEGAYLLDKTGHRFMPDYDGRAELAPRDIVARSIVEQMDKTRHGSVYLSLAHLDAAYVRSRFPGITAVCRKFGLDLATDRIPVRPGAHYMIGGVTIDEDGRTTLPGLWAAGEVTSSGLHGANRLASNSLLEGLVFGARAGTLAAAAAREQPDTLTVPELASRLPTTNTTAPLIESADPSSPVDPGVIGTIPIDIDDITASLKSLMWRNVGVRREAVGLGEAEQEIATWSGYVLNQTFDSPAGWELQNLLTLAQLMVRAATMRTESRGVHLRRDYPQSDDSNWNRHIAFTRSPDGAVTVTPDDVTARADS